MLITGRLGPNSSYSPTAYGVDMADNPTGTSVTLVIPTGHTTVPPPTPLPRTGFELSAALLLAVLLLALGATALYVARPITHLRRNS